METLYSIKSILRELRQKQDLIIAKDQKSYNIESERLKKQTSVEFCRLRDILPDLIQVNYSASITKNEAKEVMDRIKQSVASKYFAKVIPTGEILVDNICDNIIETPAFTKWQSSKSAQNFVINYSNKTKDEAARCMCNLLMNILLSLPVKSVHLSFTDLNMTGAAGPFTRNLDKSLRNEYITSARELEEFIEKSYKRLSAVVQDYGDIARYNEEQKRVTEPYEIMTLLDYPNKYNMDMDSLSVLFEKSYKAGIHFVVLHNVDDDPKDPDREFKSILDNKDNYQVIDFTKCQSSGKGLVNYTPIMENSTLSKIAFEYLNTEATRIEKRTIYANYQALVGKPYAETYGDIVVPVGETENGESVLFQMSTVGHTHSFILGQSGSGKSVFLHNIIMGAIAKYSPEDLNLYLLDFKLGGVEFNRYRNEKHVKSLLVDNSDIQITLEILRSINDSMKERGKKLRDAGVSDLASYNKQNPNNKMPQILVVADECHVMFSQQGRKNRKQYSEISEIITKIAKEGRSQGVHLVLATQTLAQTEISSEILNNISDHYLLKCAPSDSEKMVRDSSEITSNLTIGQVYYHGIDEQKQFQAYFVKQDEGEKIVKTINDKNAKFEIKDQFYFVGSQVFTIDESVCESLKNGGNYPIASIGRSIDTKQQPVNISLKNDFGENIILFGIDDEEQVTRTTMNVLKSIVYSSKVNNINEKIYVMDFLGKENGAYLSTLDALSREGSIERVDRHDNGKVLKELAEAIKNNTASPTSLFILGQERFRDLKFDNEIEVSQEENNEPSDDFGFGGSFTSESSSTSDLNTYRKALTYLLDNGADKGVHVILQLDKPEKLLFEEYVTGKLVFEKFRHLIMLRSEENAINRLNLNDDIALENLSSDPERLRAFYYNETNDSYTLFTPYK